MQGLFATDSGGVDGGDLDWQLTQVVFLDELPHFLI